MYVPCSLSFFSAGACTNPSPLSQTLQDSLTATAAKGNALEKRLALHLTGYQTRARTLRQKITEAAEALSQTRINLDAARTMQIGEEAAVGRRLESLREELQFVGRREREAQEEWKREREELETLVA